MKKIRIGYFADGPWAHQALVKLLEDETIEIAFICARNDKPDEVLRLASIKHQIDFFSHPEINSIEFYNLISKYKYDIFVSMSFNQIFKKKMFNLPPLGTINCHAGKLPFYRGRNVLNWVLINDEKDFGITVHYIDEGIDTGDIILQKSYCIDDADDYSTLLARSYQECGLILYAAIKIIQQGNVDRVVQTNIDPLGFYCIARKEGDEVLDWKQNSREIFNFVRALCHPGPRARTILEGKEVHINKLAYIRDAASYKGIPGSVIGIESGAFLVKTLDSFVRVTEWSGYLMPKIGDRFN
jgi:methionyl-tRNA formyltransferase